VASEKEQVTKLKQELEEARRKATETKATPQNTEENTLPEGWQEVADKNTGKTYYWNQETGKTAWDRPGGPAASAAGGGQVKKLEAERTSLRKECDELRSQCTQATEQVAFEKEQVAKLKQELEEARRQSTGADSASKEKITALEAECVSLRSQCDSLRADAAAAKRRAQATEQQAARLQLQADEAGLKIDTTGLESSTSLKMLPQDEEECHRTFLEFDTTGNKLVDFEELCAGLVSFGNDRSAALDMLRKCSSLDPQVLEQAKCRLTHEDGFCCDDCEPLAEWPGLTLAQFEECYQLFLDLPLSP